MLGAYTFVAYSQASYNSGNVSAGEVMVSPQLTGNRRGVLIGISPIDSPEALVYADADISLTLTGSGGSPVRITGEIVSKTEIRTGSLLLLLQSPTVGTITAGATVELSMGNKISASIDDVREAVNLTLPRLLPALPAEGSRNDRIPKFDGDTLGWEVDGGTGGGGSGAYTYSQVGSDITVNSATSAGPSLDDLNDVFFAEVRYTAQSETGLHFWSSMNKADITTTPYKLQIQGSGAAYIPVVRNATGQIQFSNAGTTNTAIVISLWNVTGSVAGPAGPAGPAGSGGGLSDSEKRHYATNDAFASADADHARIRTSQIALNGAVWEDTAQMDLAFEDVSSALGQRITSGAGTVTLADLQGMSFNATTTLVIPSAGSVKLVGRLPPRHSVERYRVVDSNDVVIVDTIDLGSIIGGDENDIYYDLGSRNAVATLNTQVLNVDAATTTFNGALGTATISQVNDAIGGHVAAWPGDLYAIPHELSRQHTGATTFSLYLTVDSGVYPTGARMEARVGGSTGTPVAIQGGIGNAATVAINAAGMTNIIQSGATNGYVPITLRILPASGSTPIGEIHGIIPVYTPGRFETALAASPALVPTGTHTLHVVVHHTQPEEVWAGQILISDLTATLLEFNIDTKNPTSAAADEGQGDNAAVNLTYNSTTRRLTYAAVASSSRFSIKRIVAIGYR